MSESIQILRATTADIDTLLRLGRQTFIEAYAAQNSEENMTLYLADNFNAAQLLKEFDEPYCQFFIAWSGDTPAGFTKLRLLEHPPELTGRKHLELQRIYVLNAFQGKKIGKLLMEHAKNTARNLGFEVLWLGVWKKNLKALEFYQYLGFEKFGEHIFHFGEEEHLDDLLKLEL